MCAAAAAPLCASGGETNIKVIVLQSVPRSTYVFSQFDRMWEGIVGWE